LFTIALCIIIFTLLFINIVCVSDMKDSTTITVKKKTLLRLMLHCRKNQSYDNLINVLLDNEEAVEKAAKEVRQQ